MSIKTEEEPYEKIIDISRNNEYTTGNYYYIDYDYFKKYYKLIQQINFIGKLEEATNVFIIIDKEENTILEFSQNLANVRYK